MYWASNLNSVSFDYIILESLISTFLECLRLYTLNDLK